MKKTLRALWILALVLLCLSARPFACAEGAGETVDLSALTHEEVDAAVERLLQTENLARVNLGADRAVTALEQEGTPLPAPLRVEALWGAVQELPAPETGEERLSWADIRKIVEAVPQAEVEYRFHISDLRFSTLSEELDLNHIRFDDEGALIREILPCMRNLKILDMDFCGVSNESMAEIRDAYPEIDVIWRVWFGGNCSVRTDVERLLVSNIYLTNDNTPDLRYCTKVKYLDVGHDGSLSDLSFIREMRDLEVLVVSITDFHDLSPLTGLEKLEFFEGCCSTSWEVIDLSPLGTCPNLEHINICQLHAVEGYEAFANLKKLQRLWIGASTPIPAEAVETLRAALPQAEINTTEGTGCMGTWRYDDWGHDLPRYALLREQFRYSEYDSLVPFVYNDPDYFSPNRK